MATAALVKGALVVVDMQNDYCNADGVYPRHGLNCFDLDSVVPTTVATVTACKAHGIPVIYLQITWNTDARGFPVDAGLIIEQISPIYSNGRPSAWQLGRGNSRRNACSRLCRRENALQRFP